MAEAPMEFLEVLYRDGSFSNHGVDVLSYAGDLVGREFDVPAGAIKNPSQ
jgi:hypothetical protein